MNDPTKHDPPSVHPHPPRPMEPQKIPLKNPGEPEVHQRPEQPEITPNRSQPEVELPPRHSTK